MNQTNVTFNPKGTIRTTRVHEYHWSQLSWLGFILMHAILALVMNAYPMVSTIHALFTLLVGLYIVLTARGPRAVVWVTAYICGAEILWRMTKAGVFWEYGKYAVILLMVIALLRMRKIHGAGLPILYFILLIVSIPLTLFDLNVETARQAISFNLSGPLCLAVCVIFFTQTRLDHKDREILTWYLISPIIGIAALCVRGIITADELIFTPDSSFATSGGYGPNQVSAILGLGAMLLIIMAILERTAKKRWIPIGFALGLLTLSALTFSRGGLYNIAAALIVFIAFSIRSNRMRKTLIPVIIALTFIGAFVIFPQLNNFTGGMLEVRFSDTNTTGRLELMGAQIDVWKLSPIFGVGPGMSAFAAKDQLGMKLAAHTEYTRVLAEHGFFGFLSLILLLVMAGKSVLSAPKGLPQAWKASMVIWPLMVMTNAAMRYAAIGFIFGLAFIYWINGFEDRRQKE